MNCNSITLFRNHQKIAANIQVVFLFFITIPVLGGMMHYQGCNKTCGIPYQT